MIKLEPLRLLVRRTDPTLDAIVLFTVLLLLTCHGMARGWPAQLGGADGGGRAAALHSASLRSGAEWSGVERCPLYELAWGKPVTFVKKKVCSEKTLPLGVGFFAVRGAPPGV